VDELEEPLRHPLIFKNANEINGLVFSLNH
jgi:hypothetical protein